MTVTTAIATYFLIWWITLFAVLPFGIRSQHEGGDFPAGSDPGAPIMPRLGRKLIWTTIVASLIFAACYVIYTRQLITLQDFGPLFGPGR